MMLVGGLSVAVVAAVLTLGPMSDVAEDSDASQLMPDPGLSEDGEPGSGEGTPDVSDGVLDEDQTLGEQTPLQELAPNAPLTDEPDDRTAFALAARARTVTVYCEASMSQGSGWPFRASSLGATSPGSGTLIVTNAHVVEGCERGQVVIELGGQRVLGDVVGYDLVETRSGGRDLALVVADIDIEPFEVATDVEIGHWVMAVGSPSGMDGTVTFGFVANDRDGVLIFDAAISPGNSGGPLINSRGEVIGTNTWLLGEFGSLSMALRVDVLCVRLLECP